MRCPRCGVDDDRVADSRPTPAGDAIRRRRECRSCHHRFTTFERVELPELLVRKSDGSLAPFARRKVRDGMARAAKGRLDDELLDRVAAQVENAMRDLGEHVTSEQVGLAVLANLRELDEVTYVRYASVYKDFQGPEDFEKELHQLRKEAQVV